MFENVPSNDVHVSLISSSSSSFNLQTNHTVKKWFYRRLRKFILLQTTAGTKWLNYILFSFVILIVIFFLFSYFNILIQLSNSDTTSIDSSPKRKDYIEYIENLSLEQNPSKQTRAAQINELLRKIEINLKNNREILQSIRNDLLTSIKSNLTNDELFDFLSNENIFQQKVNSCLSTNDVNTNNDPDIDLHQIYEQLPFDNVDGGVWKQGWPLEVNKTNFKRPKPKLKVFIVPHSHNDPGWIKTFDVYFAKQTKHILTNAVEFMSQNPDMRFIWAETSYLSAWWETTNDAHREMLRKLIIDKRFEIVTGGWVMNDEANTHYWSMLLQMIEGHEWLQDNIGYEQINWRPKHGWAIDPFGMSPTMAYLLKLMGFRAMVIQRVHYSIKKYLSYNHQLEFRWRQYWESANFMNDDILCHLQPFYSYDIPHTCGPDPKICCQFDFKRLSKPKCPWKINPQPITDSNVEERAKTLLDQYRKKSLLYRTNSLLVPLGDDFRYDDIKEWRNQYDNYRRIMLFLNSRSEFNVEIKFATLNDYFDSLFKSEYDQNQQAHMDEFPSLVGDFFTYADRDDHYWSGYYTSKPFYKRFERILASHLRAIEILFSIGNILNENVTSKNDDQDPFKHLIYDLKFARQNLALFQHHDGITGTAKESVVVDYANRMLKSLKILETIATSSLSAIVNYTIPDLEFMHTFPNIQTPFRKHSFHLDKNTRKYFILYNSLGWTIDTQVFCFDIHWTSDDDNMPDWCLSATNDGDSIKMIQINPRWRDLNASNEPLDKRREICFQPKLKPTSLQQYCFGHCQCSPINGRSYKHHDKYESFITLYNSHQDSMIAKKPFNYHILSLLSSAPNTTIENEYIRLIFDSTSMNGLLKSWSYFDSQTKMWNEIDVKMQIMSYGTRAGKKNVQKSGAYIFIPDNKDPVPFEWKGKPKIRLTIGNLESRYEWMIDEPFPVYLRFSLYRKRPTVEMQTEFHMKGGNRELLIRFELPQIKNGDKFFTDLNGLQMIARKRYDKIPIQGNVYPMTTIAWIEDDKHRFSVISGQPLGVTSLQSSTMEIFMDRRLLQDDFRGLNQGVLDNRQTREIFRLMIEPITMSINYSNPLINSGMMFESQTLLNPIIGLTSKLNDDKQQLIKNDDKQLELLQSSLPCDLHLLNLRRSTAKHKQFSLWLHRTALSCDSKCLDQQKQNKQQTETMNLNDYFSKDIIQRLMPNIEIVNGMSIWSDFTAWNENNQLLNQSFNILPMQISSYRLFKT